MASDGSLPAWPETARRALLRLERARGEVSGARDWLITDCGPAGSGPADAQARARSEVLRIAGQVKDLIDQVKDLLQRETGDGGA